jgi:hypothetical protein
MYIFGGRSDNESLDDLLEYHFDARSWSVITTTGSAPSKRWGHSAAVIGDRMFVFGGCDGSSCFGDLYEYDFGTRRWGLVDVPHCPSPRYFHMMAVEGDKMYIVGGKDLWGRCFRPDHQILTSEGFMGMRELVQRWHRGHGSFCGGLLVATYAQGRIQYQQASRLIVNPPKKQKLMVFASSECGELAVTLDHDVFVDDAKIAARELSGRRCKMKQLARLGVAREEFMLEGEQLEQIVLKFVDSFGCCGSESLPTWIWQLKVPLLRGLLVALMRENNNWIDVWSEELRDELVWLAIEAGFSSWYSEDEKGMCRVWLSNVECVSFDAPVETEFFGPTFCVTVPNGLIFARSVHSKGKKKKRSKKKVICFFTGVSAAFVTGNCFDEVHEFRQLRSGTSSLTMPQPLMGTATPDATKVRLKV